MKKKNKQKMKALNKEDMNSNRSRRMIQWRKKSRTRIPFKKPSVSSRKSCMEYLNDQDEVVNIQKEFNLVY